MEHIYGGSATNQKTILGHPSGLFIIFFTEMWERFSYYGMRSLLVAFLTAAVFVTETNPFPGWGWAKENAIALYGSYTSIIYLSPLIGGIIADKFIGYRWAVILGALIISFGHAAMAFETENSLFIGLALLIIGTGFFKPNMTSIISEMYHKAPEKKDGAYTIYYMGVNAGAFFGILLCGYLAVNHGWSYGFGLAGIFMFLGTIQFWLAKELYGEIGDVPEKESVEKNETTINEKLNPFTTIDKVLITICSVIGMSYLIDDPLSKIKGIHILPETLFNIEQLSGATILILVGLLLFIYLIISRIVRYESILRDRIVSFVIYAAFTVFFWMAFEQAGGSLTIYARDFTNRNLTGNFALIFKIVNTILTLVPLVILSWLLILTNKKTWKTITLSNIFLFIIFISLWICGIWMLKSDFTKENADVPFSWFGILNSFFIIAFAPLFSKWWESKYNPSSPLKYTYGLLLLGIGFGFLAFGAYSIPQGATTAAVSMVWLILAYLFHTLGELCLSPVGLSQVSKLVPARMIGFMYGMWYLAIAIGNKLAGTLGGQIEAITNEYSLSQFFLIFTFTPIIAGLIIALLNKKLIKLSHGIDS